MSEIREKYEKAKKMFPKILEEKEDKSEERRSHKVAEKKFEVAKEVFPTLLGGYNVIDYIEHIAYTSAM